jgi:hypothetical protein
MLSKLDKILVDVQRNYAVTRKEASAQIVRLVLNSSWNICHHLPRSKASLNGGARNCGKEKREERDGAFPSFPYSPRAPSAWGRGSRYQQSHTSLS